MSFLFLLHFLALGFCSQVPQTQVLPPNFNAAQFYFVEVLRYCWIKRYDRTFINRLPHFSVKGFPLQHYEKLKKGLNLTAKQFPLACIDKSRPGEAFFKQLGQASFKIIAKSASRLDELRNSFRKSKNSEFLVDKYNFNVAHVACMHDNDEILKVFLERFPSAVKISTKNTHQTPLHFAVMHNSWKCCKLLLQEGANIYFRDSLGNSAIDMAISIGNFDILNLFVAETDLFARPSAQYACFRQAASVALEWGLWEQAGIFAYFGAIADLHDPLTGMNLLHLSGLVGNVFAARLKEIIPFERDNGGWYPTHVSILYGRLESLEIFSKTELLQPCPFGMNLLEFAAHYGIFTALPIIQRRLPELSVHEAVISMIERDDAIGLKTLLCFGYRPDQLSGYLIKALLVNCSFRCAEVLIKMAPRAVHEIQISGMSLTENALVRGDIRLVQFLTNLGLYENFKMASGQTPLQYVIDNLNLELNDVLSQGKLQFP